MLAKFQRISMEHWFILIAFALSLVVSFMFGYLVFRYVQVETCKSSMVVETISKWDGG